MYFKVLSTSFLNLITGDKDVYICMPTGSGKSLCFQLPAVTKENSYAIVISPLIALIKVLLILRFILTKKIVEYKLMWNLFLF